MAMAASPTIAGMLDTADRTPIKPTVNQKILPKDDLLAMQKCMPSATNNPENNNPASGPINASATHAAMTPPVNKRNFFICFSSFRLYLYVTYLQDCLKRTRN